MVIVLMPAAIREVRVTAAMIFGASVMLIGMAVIRVIPFVPVMVMIPVTVIIANGHVAEVN